MGNGNDTREIMFQNDEQNNSPDSTDIAVIRKHMRLLSGSDNEYNFVMFILVLLFLY